MSPIIKFKALLKDKGLVTRAEAIEHFNGDSGLVSRLITFLLGEKEIENHKDGFRFISKKKFKVEVGAWIRYKATHIIEADTVEAAFREVNRLIDNNYEAFVPTLDFNQIGHIDMDSVEATGNIQEVIE